MAHEGSAETQSNTLLESDWGLDPAGLDDGPIQGLRAGELGEERSFGEPGASRPGGHVALRQTRGPHAAWAHASGRELAVTQLTPGPCRGHLLRASLGDMGFDSGGFEGDLRVRGAMARKAFSIVSVLERGGVLNQWGHRIDEGDILTIPPGGELDGRFQGRTAYAVVTAPWSLVMQRAEAFEWLADPGFWTEAAVYSPPPEAREACRRVLQGCAGLMHAMGGDLPPSVIGFLRRELLDGVLGALAQVRDAAARRRGALNTARIVRGVEDFLDGGGARQGVQVDEVCQALGVSRRTLYRAFHDLLDVSPKAYLRLRDMSAARARLLDAAHRPTTVTQVALDHGFWELGRFSGAYRAMFGESPSETLKRSSGAFRR